MSYKVVFKFLNGNTIEALSIGFPPLKVKKDNSIFYLKSTKVSRHSGDIEMVVYEETPN